MLVLAILASVLVVMIHATSIVSGFTPYGHRPAVFLASLAFGMFLLSFFNPWKHRLWRELGMAQAYLVALFTEMFGLPLTIYFLTSAFGARIGLGGEEGHLWATLLARTGALPLSSGVALVMTASVVLITLGITLIVLGWRDIYRAEGL